MSYVGVVINGVLLAVCGGQLIILTAAWVVWGFPCDCFANFSQMKHSPGIGNLVRRDGQLGLCLPHYLENLLELTTYVRKFSLS